MYYITYLIVLYGAYQEAMTHKRNVPLFKFMYAVLTLMALFRYGQGQDYFNYEGVYHEVSVYTKESILGILLIDDIGYGLVNYLAIAIGMKYELFMAFLTLCCMLMFYSFLKRGCRCSMVSLLVFYSVIYMIYPLSIIRQGLNMSFFLCFMLPLLRKHKYKKYYLLSIVPIFLHASSLIFLFFPLVDKVKISFKNQLLIFLVSFAVMIFSINILSYIPIPFIHERMTTYLEAASGNMIFAKIVRCMLIFPFLLLPNVFFQDNDMRKYRILFLCGFVLYALMSFSELTSSRLWGYFLGFECLLLSHLSLSRLKSKQKVLTVLYFLLISMVLWVKDIGGAIQQGKYRNCTVVTYPYISIFEGDETVDYYRTERGHAYVETN